MPVVLIEKGKMGGDCLNYGCVPSKALLAAARHATEPRRVTPFGLTLPRAEIDFAKVNAHVHAVIAAIAPNDSRERFTGLGVQVIERRGASASILRLIVSYHLKSRFTYTPSGQSCFASHTG